VGEDAIGGDCEIGVLDLQGDVREHVAALKDLGVSSRRVKRPADLIGVAGLILPGGESTTLSMLLESTGLFDPIAALLTDGLPVLGTCAGLVLLATEVLDGRPDQRVFGALPAVVRRNGFGRQLQSFETTLTMSQSSNGEGVAASEFQVAPLPAVFIRAPKVVSVGPDVQVLAELDQSDSRFGDAHSVADEPTPVLIRHGKVLASSFHPELTLDRRIHRLFTEICGHQFAVSSD
jgi:5'-phosphate synthase pdxT subunit